MLISDPCIGQNTGRRRIFWTTVDACGSYTACGMECAIPGLKYVEQENGRTIVNDEWLRGLILNILNTKARNDERCPSPAAVYGHWSESYRGDGLYIGSRLWNAANKDYYKVTDAVKAIGAAIKSDMGKLKILGLADEVDVKVTYKSSSAVEVEISTVVRNVRHTLNLAGAYASDTWVWR